MTTKLPLFKEHLSDSLEGSLNQDLPQTATDDVQGPTWWKSLDERDATEASLAIQKDEFPQGMMPAEMMSEDGTFKDGEGVEVSAIQRRDMLKLMGASMALAGMGTGCIRRPEDKILPYSKMPEHLIPGVPNYFATTLHTANGATGVLVESHDGRPTKIEGNPDHSMSKGGVDAATQAEILNIYDTDRSATPLETGHPSTWEAFAKVWEGKLKEWRRSGGKGLAIIGNTNVSPTEDRIYAKLKKTLPGARIVQWNPMALNNTSAGAEMVFGLGSRVHTSLDGAKVMVSLDSDFLAQGPESVLHSKQYGKGRNGYTIRSAKDAHKMTRLYAVESVFSTTGSNADNRLRIAASDGAAFLSDLAVRLFSGGAQLPEAFGGKAAQTQLALKSGYKSNNDKFIPALAKDLLKNKGHAVILVGERRPAAVHALALLVNAALGAYDAGLCSVSAPFPPAGEKANAFFAAMGAPKAESSDAVEGSDEAQEAGGTEGESKTAPAVTSESFAGHWAFARPSAAQSTAKAMQDLIALMTKGAIKDVVLLGSNPEASTPAAWGFKGAIGGKWVVHAGLIPDEGSVNAKWHVPLAHDLEAWGDAAAYDGTVSLVQPLIAPLLDGRSSLQLLAEMANERNTIPYKLVRETWIDDLGVMNDAQWRKALHDGVMPLKSRRMVRLRGNKDAFEVYVAGRMEKVARQSAPQIATALTSLPTAKLSKSAVEVVFTFDNKVLDGRGANNPWMQELSESMTKLCWGNALLVGPSLANELGLQSKLNKNGYEADVVSVKTESGSVELPVFILPGAAPHTVSVARGYGRAKGGEVSKDVGTDVSDILPKDGSNIATGVQISRVNKTFVLASTQDNFSVDQKPIQSMEKISGQGTRPIARNATLDEYKKNPRFAKDADLSAVAGGALVQRTKDDHGHDTKKFWSEANPTKPNRGIQLHDEVGGFDYSKGTQWGMVIDLNACTSCNACVVACQSENNIPSVGKEQILMGRELSWIRIDRYFRGDVNDPETIHQFMACSHCENAPCEPVCPVAATVHDTDGINGMVYNRCIGTRYCANNCPTKVRRFNYFDFSASAHLYVEESRQKRHELYKIQRNPDVTVRFRGVMEKCSYCTQRIQEAKFIDKRAGGTGKDLKDGVVVPACQQTCPADAITFGNINDKNSRVSELKQHERNYEVLSMLNIRPRTTYLAKIKNPNPELV
ncbi:MAG: TAT-variant-translocated molybdopterin oxidoreductase [Deltaproteobacteria bacterium]|nr:TAT-variant-translocated molybdopterin oxidoreductase [Deltaproteobacteria bacterium]